MSSLSEQFALHLAFAARFREVCGAKVDIGSDLMRMYRAEMPIAGFAGFRLVVALEFARRRAAVDGAVVRTFAAARADDSGYTTGKAKGCAGHLAVAFRCRRPVGNG
jgi:hypothetical protein